MGFFWKNRKLCQQRTERGNLLFSHLTVLLQHQRKWFGYPSITHIKIFFNLDVENIHWRCFFKSTRKNFSWTFSSIEILCNNWWLVRVTLVVAWWLFAPKFWEVVGTYESLFCSKMNAASVVVTCEVVGTLNHYKMVKKKFELCTLRGGGDIKTFQLSLAP